MRMRSESWKAAPTGSLVDDFWDPLGKDAEHDLEVGFPSAGGLADQAHPVKSV